MGLGLDLGLYLGLDLGLGWDFSFGWGCGLGLDIFLLKDSYQINYHQDILFGNFNNFDIKYNFHDYVHLEIVNDETNDYDIFELMESNSYHVLLAKETNNIKIQLTWVLSIWIYG